MSYKATLKAAKKIARNRPKKQKPVKFPYSELLALLEKLEKEGKA